MIGFGIAQRTVFAQADEVSRAVSVTSDAPVTVIDGTALTALPGSQTLTVRGDDKVFTAYGRTSDVLAWVGKASYNLVSMDAESGQLISTLVRGTDATVPDPNGSDLWLDQYLREKQVVLTVGVPADVSFVVVADGTKPAPSDISLAWPVDNSTPWSGTLIIGGAVALLAGLILLLLAISHMRKSRGPRRRTQKMPRVPRKPLYKPSRKAIEKPVSGRRALMPIRVAGPLVVIGLTGALALSGCSIVATPAAEATVTANPSASTDGTAPVSIAPAATVRQVQRIIGEISKVTAGADTAKDATLLATRLDGAALELRVANYAIRNADASVTALPPIPPGPVKLTLPQQTDTWPRTILAVVQDDKDPTVPPVAIFLNQADARSNYRASYVIALEPSRGIPDVAPAAVGAPRLALDSPLLKLSPTAAALAYADILETDSGSKSFADFDGTSDSLRAAVGLAKKKEVRAALPTTASVAFGHAIGPAEAIALATNDAGAIVAVHLYESTTVVPVEAGAAVNPAGQVKALSGLAISTKGVVATYGDQLLFYVPPAGSDAKIILLGYSQGLVKAREIA